MLAATRTVLRGAGRVHPDQRSASFFRFAVEDRDELAPASIVHGLGQHRACQSLDVQIFDGDHSVLAHQCAGRLVVEIAPLVGDVLMHAGHGLACLLPTAGTLLPACQLALSDAESPLGQPEMPWVGDFASVRQDGKRGQPHVNTDASFSFSQVLRFGHRQAEAHVPPARLALAVPS
jgi:hypothetical protein